MKGRRLLALPVLALILSCGDDQRPTGPRAPTDPSEIILDGAHGGNKDFFFLPPLVPLPLGNPDFELGEFNNTLKPSLRVEICQLRVEHYNADGLPTEATRCVSGNPLKTFPAGSVNLVNLPRSQWGWWSLFGLPPDGFYYVLWNTRQSSLKLDKYYRIKVLINGSPDPLGVADVDPMSSLRQWKYSKTGQVVQMVDDVHLPIPFRVEQGALCDGGDLCTSVTVTNDNPNGNETIVQVAGDDGIPLAGILLPDGWLPEGGPQSVVFTITRVNTGVNNVPAGTQQFPCHGNLPLQQFDACFNYSTIPELQPIDATGRQFSEDVEVIAAVCFVLHDREPADPREQWVQLWSSEPGVANDQPKPLKGADASRILSGDHGQNCETPEPEPEPEPIGYNGSNPLVGLASAGWQKVKAGAGRLFSVKTAYAVDLGIGGIIVDISNIGPALSAEMNANNSTSLTLGPDATTTRTVRVLGTRVHDGRARTTGIAGFPITFTASGGSTLRLLGSEDAPTNSVTVLTNLQPIDAESPVSGGGFAPVNWTMPGSAGVYTLTATGPAFGAPVTFTATVTPAVGFNVLGGSLTANGQHTCGLTGGGAAYCWGYNGFGSVGDGSTTNRATPVAVTGGLAFAKLSAGGYSYHACGLTSGGAAHCWGRNDFGQLGDGTTANRTTPVAMAGGFTFASLTGGLAHTCGLTTSGAAYCWGNNFNGQLGDGTTTSSMTPVAVSGERTFASLTASGSAHTCGLTSDGAAYCWGHNAGGQLGDGTTADRMTPVAVSGERTFASVTVGAGHTCGLTSGGAAYCWGNNGLGELGDGSTTSSTTPVAVAGGFAFASLSAGANFTCGLTGGGAVYCWGRNELGQLGDGTTALRTTPVAVTGGFTFARLTVGGFYACGQTSGGAAYCWGLNIRGELGDGTMINRTTPVAVATP